MARKKKKRFSIIGVDKWVVVYAAGAAAALVAAVVILLLVVNSGKGETRMVQITKDGFIPSTLAIPDGTTVTWQNLDNNPHQVQANPYPTGDSLPGLHSKTVLGPGATYSYTFHKSGNFGYHDQLHPTTNGEVDVQ